jgi:hypothetical protein
MTSEQRSSLVLAFARVLYVNGQATEQTVAAAEQLGRILGLRAKVMPRWGELQLQSDDENGRVISEVAADPSCSRLRPGLMPWGYRSSSASSIQSRRC